MATARQNILVVEVEPEVYVGIERVLRRINFDVDRLPTATGALELVSAVPFSALILRFPLQRLTLEEFLSASRTPSSASHDAPVALLAAAADRDRAAAYLDTGVDLVIANEDAADDQELKLCRLLGILPRKAVRLLVRLDVALEDSKRDRFMAQSRDVSASGMFLSTTRLYPVGSRARVVLTLPDDPAPLTCEVEVVRHGDPRRDGTSGMGVRFVDVPDDDRARLERALGPAGP